MTSISKTLFMLQGHAFEARLYAENVANNFLPATGVVRRWQVPANASFFNNSSYVRVDSGVSEGDAVSVLHTCSPVCPVPTSRWL